MPHDNKGCDCASTWEGSVDRNTDVKLTLQRSLLKEQLLFLHCTHTIQTFISSKESLSL